MCAARDAWNNLSERQKVIVKTACLLGLTWLFDQVLDVLFGKSAVKALLGWIWGLIHNYVLTSNIAFLLAGALVVAFFSDIKKFAVRIGRIVASRRWSLPPRLLVATITTLAAVIAITLATIWALSGSSQLPDEPHTFVPPMSAMRDAKGTLRAFTTLTLSQVQAELDWRTSLQRRTWVHANENKWIAVTGKLTDSYFIEKIPPFFQKDVVDVTINGSSLRVDLYFDVFWQSRVANIAKGGNAFAVCHIGGKSFFGNTYLVDCEPISGPR